MSSRKHEQLPPLSSSFEGFGVGISAIPDRNGNSRRGWLLYSRDPSVPSLLVAFIREDAGGTQPIHRAYPNVHFTPDFIPVAASTFLNDFRRVERYLPARRIHVDVDMAAGPDHTAVTIVPRRRSAS